MDPLHDTGCPDDTFGPWAGPSCRGGFDFTLLFEETILCILLQSVFILCLPIRMLQLARLGPKVAPGPIRPLKTALAICLAIFNLALVGLWAKTSSDVITHTRATTASASLTFIASIGVCLLSWVEHERSYRPSFLLSIWLYISILLDLARTRTLWMLGATDRSIPALFTTTFAIRVVLAVLESVPKRSLLPPQEKECSPEVTRGVISTAAFGWLFPLLRTGYSKVFAVDDLYPVDNWLRSKALHETLLQEWEKVPDKAAPNALVLTWLRVCAGTFWAPAIPRLFIIAFTYAQPFLIQSAVQFADSRKGMPYDNYGYGLIGAFVLVFAGQAIAVGQYYWRLRRMISVTRGGLIGLVYDQSLNLDLNAPGANPLAALTHVNGDTDAAQQALYQTHDLWSSIVEIVVADYLIWRQMGAACAIPIVVAVVAVIVSGLLAIPTGSALAAWLLALQQRVVKTAQTLGSIKWIKMSGLGDAAFTSIRDLRTHELQVSLKYRLLVGGSMIIMIFAPVWSPVLTFSFYAGRAEKTHNFLSPALVFTSYSLISLLNGPLSTLTSTLPTVAGGIAAFQRIQNFLNGARRIDRRNMIDDGTGSVDRPDQEKVSDATIVQEKAPQIPGIITPPPSNDSRLLESSPSLGSRQTLDENLIASVQGKHRWTPEGEPVIDIVEFNVPRHRFTVLLGPVGCGKSTLLKSLLGELSSFEGTIRTAYSGVAYCDQTPWIPNDTVRNVIIGGGAFDELWYRRVVKAAELDHDLNAWPRGDETSTASKGLAMSGGQKQRLALARALYSGKELIVLDDVFKALDPSTERSILENLWGPQGLLRTGELTTLLASSDEKLAAYAEHVVALDEKGHIRASGTPEEIAVILGISISKADLASGHQGGGGDETAAAPAESALAQLAAQLAPPPPADSEFTDPARRLGAPGTFRQYGRSAGWWTVALVILSLAVYAFCGSFPTIWLGWWADEAAVHPDTPLGKWLGVYAALAVGSLLGAGVTAWLFMIVIINKCGFAFHDSLLNTVSRAPMSFFATVDTGTTLTRFSEDIRMIDMEVPAAAFGIGTTSMFLLAQFIIIVYVTKYIAVVVPILVFFFYIMQHFYLRTSRQLRIMDIELKAPIAAKLVEMATGLVSIRAFQWSDRILDQGLAVLDDSQRPCYLLGSVQCWLNFAVEMLMLLIALLFIVVTTVLRQHTGAVNMGVGLSSLLSISTSAKLLINFWVILENALGAIGRVNRFTKVTELETTIEESPLDPNDKSWPSAGAIELRGVTASYPGSGKCLEDISLYIPAGLKVAITGRTGSGKSSLLLCFLRMLELDAGSIVIDGVDISTLPHDYLRSRIVASPQEPYIMTATVRHNVDPTNSVSDAEIQAVLERVQLWAKAEAIGGLDTTIAQEFLSPGEAQLLVLARAMLRKSKVLLLDEPSGSLDAASTELIGQVIKEWFHGWTVIAITHNVDSLVDYDAVVTLDGGKMTAYGPAPGR